MSFFDDTYTESSDTVITSHTSDSGATYTIDVDGGQSFPAFVQGGTGFLIPLGTGSGWATATANVTPPSATYDVIGTFKIFDNDARTRPGIIGHYDRATDSGVFVFYDCFGGWDLRERTSGSDVSLATGGSPASVGSTPIVILRLSPTTAEVIVDSVSTISATTITVSGAGHVGIVWNGQSTAGNNQAFTALSAVDAGGGGGSAIVARRVVDRIARVGARSPWL